LNAGNNYASVILQESNVSRWRIGSVGGTSVGIYRDGTGFYFNIDTSGNVVFNDLNRDADFRVASDLNAYMLFVDAGNDAVGIGMVPLTTFGNRNSLEIGGNTVANLSLQAAIGETLYNFYINGSGQSIYSNDGPAGFQSFNNAVSAGWSFQTYPSGTAGGAAPASTDLLALSPNGTIFNEGGADIDFRVESNNQTHAIFVDAGEDVVAFNTSNVLPWYQRAVQGPSWGITELLGVDQTGWSTGCYQDAYGYDTNWKFAGSYAATLYTQTGDHNFLVTSSTRGANNAITWKKALNLSDSLTVFNEDSNDIDFRVESDANTHMLFVDAGNNKVSVGTSLMPTAPADFRAYLGVHTSHRVISAISEIYNSGNGRTFTITGGGNGSSAYLSFSAMNHNGTREETYYFYNASGNWTATAATSQTAGTPPTVTVSGSGTATVTVQIVGAGSNPSFYSGGFVNYEFYEAYVSIA
jgi:hypothetical protein